MDKKTKAEKFMETIASNKNTHSARARRRKMKRALDKYSSKEDDKQSSN